METADDLTLVTGEELHARLSGRKITTYYEGLLRILHGLEGRCSEASLRSIIEAQTEILVFAVCDLQVVATAQASLLQTPPRHKVMLNNVIVTPAFQDRKIGRHLVTHLLEEVKLRWGTKARLTVFLTNAPRKGNGGFYEKLGFRPRQGETMTLVWKLDI